MSAGPIVEAIAARGLRRSFGPQRGVDAVDLTITQGETVALLGSLGSGKTTLVELMVGLCRPDAGTVRVFGLEPRTAVAAGRVSAVVRSGGLLPDFTVAETVRTVAGAIGAGAAASEVMGCAGIADVAGRRVGDCTPGEVRRLRLALALLPDPDVLVLDEPAKGLDADAAGAFWAAMRDDAEAGRTVVFTTSDRAEAQAFAGRIVVLAHGRVVADGMAATVGAQATVGVRPAGHVAGEQSAR